MTRLHYEITPNSQTAQLPIVQVLRLGVGSWQLGVVAFTEKNTLNGE